MGFTSFAHSCRRHTRSLGTNPLVRLSDRIEALAILLVLGTVLISAPVAAYAGRVIYEAGVRTATEQSHSRHPVEAVAVQASASLSADLDNPTYVRVQWREGSQMRTEGVITPTSAKVGDSLQIWLDENQRVVAAPLTADDARMSAAVASATVWAALVAGSALLAFGVRQALDRSRERAWGRELLLLAHNDDGWANRYP